MSAGAIILGAITFANSLFQMGMSINSNMTYQRQKELQEALDSSNEADQYSAQFVQSWMNYKDAQTAGYQIADNIDADKLSMLQGNSTINAYRQYQARWQTQYQAGLSSIRQQGKSSYSELMAAYANQRLTTAVRGQSGGSAGILETLAKSNVIDLTGTDMRLDANGGTYGYTLTEYFLDQLADRTETQGQIDIEKESWEGYYDSYLEELEAQEANQSLQSSSREQIQQAYDKLANVYGDKVESTKSEYESSWSSLAAELEAYRADDSEENGYSLYSQYLATASKYGSYKEADKLQSDALAGFTDGELSAIFQADGFDFKGWESTFGNDTAAYDDFLKLLDSDFGKKVKRQYNAVVARMSDDGNDEPSEGGSGTYSAKIRDYDYTGTGFSDMNGTPTKVSSKDNGNGTTTVEFTAI